MFVTTFSKDLYEATGKDALVSFEATQKETKLLCAYEGFQLKQDKDFLQVYNLDHNTILHDFLRANRDVIPDYMGGLATHCNCRDWHIRHSKYHKKGCHYHWMNRNASRWFRKVVALDYALHQFSSDYLVWVDCDCVFRKHFPIEQMDLLAKNVAFVYCKGVKREAIEAGVMIFNLKAGGDEIIRKTLDRYTSKEYRNYDRWDDGYQWYVTVQENPKIKCKDLITEVHQNPRYQQEVIPTTILGKYIEHKKGTHGRKLNIMK